MNVLVHFSSEGGGDIAGNKIAERFLHGPYVDQVLAQENVHADGTTWTWWTLGNHLGTIRDSVSQDGTVRLHYNYSAFGTDLGITLTLGAARRFSVADSYMVNKFTGREYDSATGLYYYRARWYDSSTGRFMSEDPMGFAAGESICIAIAKTIYASHSLNLRNYADL